ncbi:MAG: tRNA guanosine(34) transglycosylase Tgt [Dehalococcoidia bacterium]|nr:tRNA guanosine(34) transglycosylase Tgt [Dehalococcoidia bacterium]
MFAFRLTSSGRSPVAPRTGVITTARGEIRTPAFMPVGTLATVKSLLPEEVASTRAEVLLVNAYHLYLRPGHHIVASMGGVHRFMDWPGPVLSDSGGFQVFSLARLGKVDEDGVRFRSHIDGSEHFYTPELAMEVQAALGVDIAMPLDHVLAGQAEIREARDAAERTLRWYERCRQAAGPLPVFAIVQGGIHHGLRRWHARACVELDPPGYSIGGLSVGEAKADTWPTVEAVTAELPVDRPRYLMGVGSPEDLVEAVARGVDMFDCVLPSRLGRNGSMFTGDGRANVRNARYRQDPGPVDPECDCLACSRFSMAYIHHLFRNEELLGYRLATIHNIRYLVRLTERMRAAIEAGQFSAFAAEYLGRYRPSSEAVRSEQKAKWLAQSGFEAQAGGQD